MTFEYRKFKNAFNYQQFNKLYQTKFAYIPHDNDFYAGTPKNCNL